MLILRRHRSITGLALALAALPASAFAAAGAAGAAGASTVTRLPLANSDGVLVEPGGVARVLMTDDAASPAATEVRVAASGSAKGKRVAILSHARTTSWVTGALLPNRGAVIAYVTRKPRHPQVRLFVRSHGKNGPASIMSDPDHAAEAPQVFASASGAVSVAYTQHVAHGPARQLLAVRGVGADDYIRIPATDAGGAFARVVYNDAGDGVLVLQANGTDDDGNGGSPALVVRRIFPDGTVTEPITVDAPVGGLTSSAAAVAPDGTIGLLWNWTSRDGSTSSLQWSTIPKGGGPAPITRLPGGGRSSFEGDDLSVSNVNGTWIATAGAPQGTSPTVADLRIFESAGGQPMALAHTYAGRHGLGAAQLVAHAGGAVDVVWLGVSDGSTDVRAQVLRARRSAAGGWSTDPVVVDERTATLSLRGVAPTPTGGLAIVEQLDPSGKAERTYQLVRADS